MTARNWIHIVALSSAFGLAGAAIAQNTEGTTSTEDRAGMTSPGAETPSAGAIVTPEDKARGMGQDSERSGILDNGVDESAPGSDDDASGSSPAPLNGDDSSANPGASEDQQMGIDPGPSSDDESSADPGLSDDDELSINPGPTEDDESSVNPGLSADEELSVNPGLSSRDEASRNTSSTVRTQ
ncbi:MAG TPA: hypothetical protein VFL49_00205 [Pseudolabrys sp.]|nr:hypothetical protein [Pseudolabrys sp.]